MAIGQELSYFPPVNSPAEAFERLQKWSGQRHFENLKESFLENYPVLTADVLLDELEPIKEFIRKAKMESSIEPFHPAFMHQRTRDNLFHEYQRISEGFYKSYECLYNLGGTASLVFGKYFLYKTWLEVEILKLKVPLVAETRLVLGQPADVNESTQEKTEQHKLTLHAQKEVARKHIHLFSGFNVQKKRIMSYDDYLRLESYTLYLIEFESLPPDIQKIKPLFISKHLIKYTYYLIHKELYGNYRIKDIWLTFLEEVFEQFKDAKDPKDSVLKKNFRINPLIINLI